MLSTLPPPKRVFALVPAALALIGVLNVDVPYFVIRPGPARDVQPLIAISGAPVHRAPGKLLYTTVQLGSVRLGDAVHAWLSPVVDVVPRVAIVPPGRSEKQVDKVNRDEMEESKRAAAASALSYLGYPVRLSGRGARVESLVDGTPAARSLQVGDVIIAVDGRPVSDPNDLVGLVRSRKVGEEVSLRVLRSGGERDVAVRTVRSGSEPDAPMIGVTVRPAAGSVELPFKVDIRLENVGGPSAGLMFALGVVELLQEDDLTRGYTVAGTGVIAISGRVSPVGGVVQKVAAAEREGAHVFLVPHEELAEARRAAGRIRVVGVKDLAQAVQALRGLPPPVQASRPGR